MALPRRAFIASAPTRLDFGGGWTDVPPFDQERGGFVCSVAINRRSTVRMAASPLTTKPTGDLVAASLARAEIRDVEVDLHNDFPVSAGLGGSSAAGVALAAACAAWRGETMERSAMAEWSRAVEVDALGIAGGRQDHYAAAFGGALGLTFDGQTSVEQLVIPESARGELESRCLLAFTGESRISANTISAVLDAYRDRVPRVVYALDCMAQLARRMRDALLEGDIDALAQLVDDHWHHQRSLHPAITTERIDDIESRARSAGATAIKALGASGGGCVVVFAPANRVGAVSAALEPELLRWRLDWDGVMVKAAE